MNWVLLCYSIFLYQFNIYQKVIFVYANDKFPFPCPPCSLLDPPDPPDPLNLFNRQYSTSDSSNSPPSCPSNPPPICPPNPPVSCVCSCQPCPSPSCPPNPSIDSLPSGPANPEPSGPPNPEPTGPPKPEPSGQPNPELSGPPHSEPSGPPNPGPSDSPNSQPSCPPNPAPKTPSVMLTLLFINIQFANSKTSNKTSFTNLITESMETLTSRQTIKEVALLENSNITFPDKEELLNMFKSDKNIKEDNIITADNNLKGKVKDAITRVLIFYDGQMHQTAIPGLFFLKGIDDKHGKVFQNQFPLNEWIHSACNKLQTNSFLLAHFCQSISFQWKNRSGGNKTSIQYWKNVSILQNELNEMDEKVVTNLGNEAERIWPTLNIQCLTAVGSRCDLPLACEQTFLDPTPRSQYMLSHQVLLRMLIDMVDCPSLKSFVTEENTYTKFCSKMYMEAKYLDVLNIPVIHRDLFAQLVGFCGYLGYTNFFRRDWLESMVSWQSKSDIGCFVKDSRFPVDVITNDMGFMRRASKTEDEYGIKPNEKCLPHLTVVNLIALSTYWDYLMDNLDENNI